MKRKTIAFLLAPSPVITVFFILLVDVLNSPDRLIDGTPDDAPHRAAILLIPVIPIFFYPILLCIFGLHIFIAEKMKEDRLRNHFYVDIVMSIFNKLSKEQRFFPVSALILLAATVTGCAMPPYITSLDEILEQEGIKNRVRYGYRCTAGAHRGASEEYKENTLAALKAADKYSKYAFIEFDVQYSKDRRIVVYHDKRMLRLYGDLRAIGNTTFAELSKMTGGEIAAYDEVISVLRKKLNIEIKSQGDNQEDERLVDEIIADIKARKRDNDVLISSISSDVIKYVNRNYPSIQTGQVLWLTSSTYLHFDGLTKKLYEDINTTRADYLMLHVANLRNIDDLLKFKPKGKTIVFWDFDDNMYIVHKDISDRLWGDSGIRTFFQFVRYKIVSIFHRPSPEK